MTASTLNARNASSPLKYLVARNELYASAAALPGSVLMMKTPEWSAPAQGAGNQFCQLTMRRDERLFGKT
jgi:hypothetical protein